MTTQNNKATDEVLIRELMDNWANALRAKDINKLMAHYAPDIVVFYIQPPLEYRGAQMLIGKAGKSGYPRFKARLTMKYATLASLPVRT
jgi:ketosteroid isomerase-like protein